MVDGGRCQDEIVFCLNRRIIRVFEDTNEDYLMVADSIGVNRLTARSIVYLKVESLKDHVELLTMFMLTMK